MESQEKHVRNLMSIISKEFEHYKRIYELVKKEQSVLVNTDIDGLEKNLIEQQTVMSLINKLEDKRLQELEVIGIYLGESPENLKIALIARRVDGDLAKELTTLETKFKSVIQEILNLNKSNKFLINRSMQFLDKNIQVFFGAMEDKGVYTPITNTSKSGAKTASLVDWKA